MKDMIEQIVSTDRKSREAMDKTKQLKLEYEQKISNMKEKKRNEYIESARISIKEMEKQEKLQAEKRLNQVEISYREVSDRIDRIYADNHDMWINQIFKRVIEG